MIDLANGSMQCYPIQTQADGPGPRVGHASLLVGNAFIVFGGDTKLEDGDVLDDTLYLLNTCKDHSMSSVHLLTPIASKQWSRAAPSGTKPAGRYGHTLNILGSKLYIFGGQVEGFFFNDLVAFDLNTLQVAGNRWEMLIQNGGAGQLVPPARTNHTVVSWQDKLYLFGGTDGSRWFNDVWTYDPATNSWSEQDCIGYIPAPREGHAAALINDTMYIFGGRIQDGTDLGDLVAFKISARRWYMFQNMGASPSPRSGHSMTAFGNHIMVLAGEPSSAPRDPTELSLAYVLDTNKIRYPTNDPPGPGQQAALTKPAGIAALQTGSRPESPQVNGVALQVRGPQVQPQPLRVVNQPAVQPQQAQQAKFNKDQAALRAKTPSRGAGDRSFDQPREEPVQTEHRGVNGLYQNQTQAVQPVSKPVSAVPSRSGSHNGRQQASIDSDARETPRTSMDNHPTSYARDNRDPGETAIDSGVGVSPALSHQNEELVKELEAAKSRNAWYASELAMARKAGYQPTSSGNPILDQQASEMFAEDDRPLIEALLRMKAELTRVQGSIDTQSDTTASRIADIERQRDVAISEAAYAKAKLAAHGASGSQMGSPAPDGTRGVSASPDIDRVNDMSRRLASALHAQKELSIKLEGMHAEIESERRARAMAEETAEAADKRISELDSYKQKNTAEVESLRAELHDAQRVARETSAQAAEATASHNLMQADHREMQTKHSRMIEDTKGNTTILQTLRDAVAASTEKADHLNGKLEEERKLRAAAEQRIAQMRSEHESRSNEVDSLTRQLNDAHDMVQKHANEAKTHREAVLSGLGAVTSRSMSNDAHVDERVGIMTQQLEAANNMSRQNKDAADTAAERLRSAEERIAGLEAYQEQTSRENLTIRKQAQMAMKEAQLLRAEKAEIQARLERSMLDGNALEVQLRTLKSLLEERGINPADVRRSRILESPGSRYGTPDLNRIRELERQLDESLKAHEEMRQTFESREQDTTREWEEKLGALTNDHQESNKYVRALEKYLTKMKAELQKAKTMQAELEKEMANKSNDGSRELGPTAKKEWESERDLLKKEMSEVQVSMQTSVASLESQIVSLRSSLAAADEEYKLLQKDQQSRDNMIKRLQAQAQQDVDTLKRENKQLEIRATDAEHKVQMFLDQFENSVDNYRRMSRMEQQTRPLGSGKGIDAESLYSTTTVDDDEDRAGTDDTVESPQASKKGRDRTSTALDTLTTELDALRSKWETTSRNYKMSDRFDFENKPLGGIGSSSSGGPPSLKPSAFDRPGVAGAYTVGGYGGMSGWAKGLETDDESLASEESAEKLLQTPPRPLGVGGSAALTSTK